jgi:hypothetical protein
MEKIMTQKPYHQMVWIDHQVARLYGVARDNLTELTVIHAPNEDRGHIHHKAGTMGPGHVPVSHDFLRDVAIALQGAQEILIVGPADSKHALKKYIILNMPSLDKHVIGVEPMDKCCQRDLQDFASLFFHKADRMRSLLS